MSNYSVTDVSRIVKNLIDEHLKDKGWTFFLSSTKSRLGHCDFVEKQIAVSSYHIVTGSDAQVMDTILHELAHAIHVQTYMDADDLLTYRKQVRFGGVPAHGKEWKTIAVMLGATPRANGWSDGDDREDNPRDYKWKIVVVHGDDNIEDTGMGCHRFLKSMKTRYLKNRKRDTMGKLFLVAWEDWRNYVSGSLSLTDIYFFQSPPIRGRYVLKSSLAHQSKVNRVL